MPSVAIRNGLVFEGSDRPPVKTDVFIQDGRIAKIGSFGKVRAEKTIDATGLWVTPGIIDINTDSDHHLTIFTDPGQENFLRQGVTTILGGNCGKSMAPLHGGGGLNFGHGWNLEADININWKTTQDLLLILKKTKLGVNFGTLVGYSNLRKAFGSESGDLTEKQIKGIKFTIQNEIRQGAFGISFDTEKIISQPLPDYELDQILRAIGEGSKCVTSFHLAPGAGIKSAIQTIIEKTKRFSLNTEVSHFQPEKRFESEYQNAKNAMEASSSETNINFDVFPFTEVAVSAEKIFPAWVGKITEGRLADLASVAKNRKRLLKDLAGLDGKKIVIGQLPTPFSFFEGRELKELSEYYGLRRNSETFLKICEVTRGQAIFFLDSTSESLLRKFMLSPLAIISSNGFSSNKKRFQHQRNTDTFSRFIKTIRNTGNGADLEKSLAKITGTPAKKYGIIRRGLIKEEHFADIVVWKENAPLCVLVNGEIAFEEGKIKGAAGLPLYSSKQ